MLWSHLVGHGCGKHPHSCAVPASTIDRTAVDIDISDHMSVRCTKLDIAPRPATHLSEGLAPRSFTRCFSFRGFVPPAIGIPAITASCCDSSRKLRWNVRCGTAAWQCTVQQIQVWQGTSTLPLIELKANCNLLGYTLRSESQTLVRPGSPGAVGLAALQHGHKPGRLPRQPSPWQLHPMRPPAPAREQAMIRRGSSSYSESVRHLRGHWRDALQEGFACTSMLLLHPSSAACRARVHWDHPIIQAQACLVSCLLVDMQD